MQNDNLVKKNVCLSYGNSSWNTLGPSTQRPCVQSLYSSKNISSALLILIQLNGCNNPMEYKDVPKIFRLYPPTIYGSEYICPKYHSMTELLRFIQLYFALHINSGVQLVLIVCPFYNFFICRSAIR